LGDVWKDGRKIEKGFELVRRGGKDGKKTTLPHILRPYLTIVNSDLYYFRFFPAFSKTKQRKYVSEYTNGTKKTVK
jgi:hypothetical protein